MLYLNLVVREDDEIIYDLKDEDAGLLPIGELFTAPPEFIEIATNVIVGHAFDASGITPDGGTAPQGTTWEFVLVWTDEDVPTRDVSTVAWRGAYDASNTAWDSTADELKDGFIEVVDRAFELATASV